MAREKATNEKSVEKRQEALTKATQGVAAQVRRKTKKTSAPGIAVAAGDVDKGYLWENDPSLVPMTPQRRKLIDGMAAETLKRLTPAPEKVEKPSTPVEKWQAAFAKSEATWKMANTLAKALAKRSSKRWQFVDFLGPKGRESAGVVDILAIRKNSAKPDVALIKPFDLFDIVLMQVKGGSAPSPTSDDVARLKVVKDVYNAKAIVLFQWQRGVASGFYQLQESSGSWLQTTAKHLFGK